MLDDDEFSRVLSKQDFSRVLSQQDLERLASQGREKLTLKERFAEFLRNTNKSPASRKLIPMSSCIISSRFTVHPVNDAANRFGLREQDSAGVAWQSSRSGEDLSHVKDQRWLRCYNERLRS